MKSVNERSIVLNPKLRSKILNGSYYNGIEAAYLYHDCLALLEKIQLRKGKITVNTEVWHLVKHNIYVRTSDYGVNDNSFGVSFDWSRLVFHNTRMLLDGLSEVSIWLHSGSDGSKAKGIFTDGVSITTASGLHFSDMSIEGCLSGHVTIQPNKYDGLSLWSGGGPNSYDGLKNSFDWSTVIFEYDNTGKLLGGE